MERIEKERSEFFKEIFLISVRINDEESGKLIISLY